MRFRRTASGSEAMIRLRNIVQRQPCLTQTFAFALAGSALVVAAPEVMAQGYAQPVVQPLPDPATEKLNEALRALSRNPTSLDSLVAAAEASLALDNLDTAAGFIQRAEAIAPSDGRVAGARASWLVRHQQPVEALALFAQAEQAGALTMAHLGDRGLAYDLVGDNARAQADYRRVLESGADAAITRRLALSLAISGDQGGSEATLLPALQRSDLAAYRTRAFALAILGKADEAVSIAETMLPARLSGRLGPYLRYMPRLTPSQQAAAANLGAFPQADEIGRDAPTVVAYGAQPATPVPVRTADARLVPSGEPLGAREGVPRREERTATPVVRAAVRPTQTTQTTPAVANPSAAPALVAAVDAPQPVAVSTAQPIAPTPEPPPPPRDLASAFSDFSRAGSSQVVAASSGAVDITTIQPRREAPPVAAPPPKPVIPSRHWVQVATGRDTDALAFDWRRIKRSAAGLLDKPEPHVAKWGQTNRLVVGPFANAGEANRLVSELKQKDVDSFRFTSAQGEEVKPLD